MPTAQSFPLACPQCGTTRQVTADYAGREALCSCGTRVKFVLVPALLSTSMEQLQVSLRHLLKSAAVTLVDLPPEVADLTPDRLLALIETKADGISMGIDDVLSMLDSGARGRATSAVLSGEPDEIRHLDDDAMTALACLALEGALSAGTRIQSRRVD